MSWLKVCGSGLVSMCGPVSLMGFVRLAEQATMAAYITAADNRSCALCGLALLADTQGHRGPLRQGARPARPPVRQENPAVLLDDLLPRQPVSRAAA